MTQDGPEAKGDGEETTSKPHEDHTNRLLYEQLRTQVPNYDWQWTREWADKDDHYDFIQFPEVEVPIR